MAEQFEMQPYEVLVKAGDQSAELFLLKEGKLLVCALEGSKVTPISYIRGGEYLGELSFFDGRPRSAFVVTLEPCTLVKYTRQNSMEDTPSWLLKTLQSLSAKLREMDDFIGEVGIKRTKVDSIKPLGPDEHKKILSLLV